MTSNSDSPVYLIAPCYLAGPDTSMSTALTAHLEAAGWARKPVRAGLAFSHRERGGLVEAVHAPDGTPPGESPCPALSWEFTARPGPGRPSTWSVRFTPATPPELPTAFAHALTSPDPAADPDGGAPHYLQAPGLTDLTTAPLQQARWQRDIGSYWSAWNAPDRQGVVITPVAPGVDGYGGADWLLAARRASDKTVMWMAVAHPNTPTHLMRTLCTALASPAPVPRQRKPAS
ncbi:DUF317 domain-containing protein [Streptomyces monticola]|uniref:DUF317 domain-containing protein n=1 Tax=Streptomyces monticola TaxID=2666263 RepID=A0ABW2JGI1_9ACTN